MRFIHTADWHLGRLFYGVHLTDDQAFVLEQFVEVVRSEQPDAVLVAGDIYDRAVPPPEAVALLDDVLARIVLGLRVPIVVIAGNHDSPERLSFGARVLAAEGLHLVGRVGASPTSIVMTDASGPVRICAVPYAEPAVARLVLEDETVHDHQAALAGLLAGVRNDLHRGERSVLVAHAFVAGGEESESERPLSVGGAGTVRRELFDGFDYVALGHLHRPQGSGKLVSAPAEGGGRRPLEGEGRIRYSGSLLKYSFAEASQRKSLSLVELDARGDVRVELLSLTPRHDVRHATGLFMDMLRGAAAGPGVGAADDYLAVTLTDPGPVLDAMGRLREVYPNLVHVERQAVSVTPGAPRAVDHRRTTESELFSSFFEEVTGGDLSPVEKDAFVTVAEDVARKEREAG